MADTDPDLDADFARLEPLLPPGVDRELVRGELAQFMADMQPQSALDRMRIRDIVLQNLYCEFIQGAFTPVYAQLSGANLGEAGTAGERAEAFIKNLPLINDLLELGMNVRADRDRIAQVHDSKQALKLTAELAFAEMQAS